jgi:hypothetical protein
MSCVASTVDPLLSFVVTYIALMNLEIVIFQFKLQKALLSYLKS